MSKLRTTTTAALIGVVWLYRLTLGQWLSGHCRHEPTCSQYAIDALRKYGPVRGLWRASKRVSRCRPWGTRGYDPA
jgi:uncharacterized protein